MTILIAAATFPEIEPLMISFGISKCTDGELICCTNKNDQIYFLTTGVGMVNTTFHLVKAITKVKPDLSINAGIAGSFSSEIKIGDIVKVKQDRFSELGAEDDEIFLSLDDLKLGEQLVPVSSFNECSISHLEKIKSVNAITVNTVHGNEKSISKIKEKFSPDIETMEGAAFMLTCHKEKVKHIQIRSISNCVEKRNRNNWKIPLAIKNLNNFLIEFLESINHQL